MKLSIIIPVYNEEKTILELLRRVEAVNFPIEREIIIVDDGSTDGTAQLLKSLTHADDTRTNADSELLYRDLTYKIRGAAFNVRKKIGLGHKESVYQKALEEELGSLQLNFEKEKVIDVIYNDKKIGVYRPDFLIENKIILEIKALPFIGKNERQQIWTYLKGSKYKLLLLINFASKDVQIERVVYDTARLIPRQSALSQRQSALKVIFEEKNQGKGAALRRGFKVAGGEIIAIQDADLEYNPEDLPKLIQPILEGRADIVYGSRFLTKRKHGYPIFYLGNQLLSFLFLIFYGKKITDPWTCYKVFKKEIIRNIKLESRGFDLELELTAKFLRKGYTRSARQLVRSGKDQKQTFVSPLAANYKILELPISYQSRTYKEGKKIKWTDGLKAFWTLIKYRFYAP